MGPNVAAITKKPEHEHASPIGARDSPRNTVFVDRNAAPDIDERPGEPGAADHGGTSQPGQDPEETTAFGYPDAHG